MICSSRSCRKTKNVLIAGNPKGRQRPEYYLELAWLSQRLGEVSDAIDFYERALDLNYANVYWRMNFAEFLAQNGRPQKAAEQARICLRIKPGFDRAEGLLAELLTSERIEPLRGFFLLL
jgi:tetratricopeptide (TPR) repeat protein